MDTPVDTPPNSRLHLAELAQLSAGLGERVRLAVETLIRASAPVIDPLLSGNAPRAAPSDVYIAATRLVMRVVVVLFAEARELLPRDHPLYRGAYGLHGLLEELERTGDNRHSRSAAWPRLLGLFRLVAEGSSHEGLPIPAHGGGLFQPGEAHSEDGVSRVLAAFESADNVITDDTVRTLLEYLTRCPVKVRQGRGSTVVTQPVDFSALPSESIGILYEGLLDFELRRVPDGDTFAWSLVRWGGTRKGAGSFYTRPQLADPTVRRTLQPLAYDVVKEEKDERTGLMEPVEWAPKRPEEILALKVCDPAMGSGAFLVSALRFLSQALRESLSHHGRSGSKQQPHARLERDVAEACIYGVDLDPVAVELARLVMWIEARDPSLPFGFLDHKLKLGNALIGCWLDRFQGSPLKPTRRQLDAWCAVVLWPGDRLVDELAREHRFFHWELEFPEVFTREAPGFDALIGNPPWEIQKPNSKEFFSSHDPLYRTYGKQEALDAQERLFASDARIELGWARYQAVFKALSNWVKHAYVHQGPADLNTYKLFLERAHALLRVGGQLGFIVPSGLYTDKGSTRLRELFLHQCRWQWLFAFENREGIFDIHRSFKFALAIVRKGGQTEVLRAAFMRRRLEEWEEAQHHVLAYPREQVEQLSPKSRTLLELSDPRDMEVLRKLYATGVLLGDESPRGWGVSYAREFDMTNDSKLFPPRPKWEARGYRPDEYGNWLAGPWKEHRGPQSILERKPGLVLSRDGTQALRVEELEGVALPLYEGRMIGQFDFSEKGWLSGKGRTAQWREIPFEDKVLEPQFLMAREDFLGTKDREGNSQATRGLKLGFMDVSSATNSRTMIASATFDCPHGNKVPVLSLGPRTALGPLELGAVLNSFVFDFAARARLGGTTLNWFIVEETPLPHPVNPRVFAALRTAALALNCTATRFAPVWLEAPAETRSQPWRSSWAVTRYERMRVRCIIEALVAHAYGVSLDELAWILRETALPPGADGARLSPKGFWRIDQDQPVELRLPVLAYLAYRDLTRMGLDRFLAGAGWQLPDTLRLTEVRTLGCTESHEAQVAGRFGPRQLEWQHQPTQESWRECALHAEHLRVLLKLEPKVPSGIPAGASG